ncbi:GspH/FimT family pseudopilin [Caenimonas aquaedulcis]|uniref:Type II secretion system protein H n=1 Tax=Caenimonas aquaedulcis TaxID=2793270 RepID=A0A931H2S9_9BURK|nr:GspH/FimT family pseudopilin [Caenimonas aquaedulcis]MBG9387505.1 GspH/FimT family pseudopilin [Caenimonas aquaedulcis]
MPQYPSLDHTPVRPARVRGFTLIELMVAMAIIAILAAFAGPSFNSALLSNKLTSYANTFVSSAMLARSEAIKRNSVVRVCRSSNGTSCATSGTWQQGWIVFNDANNDALVTTGETIISVQPALSADYNFTGGSYNVAFQSTGGLSAALTLTLCRASPVGNQERTVKVSATGRASVDTSRNGVCP